MAAYGQHAQHALQQKRQREHENTTTTAKASADKITFKIHFLHLLHSRYICKRRDESLEHKRLFVRALCFFLHVLLINFTLFVVENTTLRR